MKGCCVNEKNPRYWVITIPGVVDGFGLSKCKWEEPEILGYNEHLSAAVTDPACCVNGKNPRYWVITLITTDKAKKIEIMCKWEEPKYLVHIKKRPYKGAFFATMDISNGV